MIDGNYFLINVALLAIGTVIIRGSFIAVSGKLKHTAELREFFSFIPAAILPAFILPAVFYHEGIVGVLGGKERLVVLLVSGVVFYFVRSTFLIIATGLVLLYGLTLI